MHIENNIIHGETLLINSSIIPTNCSLGELCLNQLRKHGSLVAQIDGLTDQKQTFKEILHKSVKLAIYLRKIGIKRDDRIAICSENNLSYSIPICAILYVGATVCPISPLYTERELKHTLNIFQPKCIFVSPVCASVIKTNVNQLSWKPKIIIIHDINIDDIPNIKQLTSNINMEDVENFQACKISDIDNHVIGIMCSSGTTGFPKGVMITDKNFITTMRLLTNPRIKFLSEKNTTLGLLPFFHAYAFSILITSLVIGAKSVILPRFEEESFLNAIEKYKVDVLTTVPALVLFLAKHPLVEKYNLSSVKTIWCGAAPLSEHIQKSVVNRLKGTELKQAYGLTETTLMVLYSPSGTRKYGSVGIVTPGSSVKVIPTEENVSEEALGPNCVGELCVKGDMIMKGYCNDKKSTAATIDADGWLHTGDLAYYDKDGYFYIVDRLKELIKYKGFQVPPAEIEAILLMCPGVRDAAVVGIQNEEAGELPLAYIVKQDNSTVTADEIIAYVNKHVSNPKRLRGGVRFIQQIPRSPSGKILRRILRNTLTSKI